MTLKSVQIRPPKIWEKDLPQKKTIDNNLYAEKNVIIISRVENSKKKFI